jgi:hypothetical protein
LFFLESIYNNRSKTWYFANLLIINIYKWNKNLIFSNMNERNTKTKKRRPIKDNWFRLHFYFCGKSHCTHTHTNTKRNNNDCLFFLEILISSNWIWHLQEENIMRQLRAFKERSIYMVQIYHVRKIFVFKF